MAICGEEYVGYFGLIVVGVVSERVIDARRARTLGCNNILGKKKYGSPRGHIHYNHVGYSL